MSLTAHSLFQHNRAHIVNASQRTGQVLSDAALAEAKLAELDDMLRALSKKESAVKSVRRWIMRNPALNQDAVRAMGRVAEDAGSSATQKIGLLCVINDVMSAQRAKQQGYKFSAIVLPRILTFLSAASAGGDAAAPRAGAAKRCRALGASECRASVDRILRNWRKKRFFDAGVLDELEGFMRQQQEPRVAKGGGHDDTEDASAASGWSIQSWETTAPQLSAEPTSAADTAASDGGVKERHERERWRGEFRGAPQHLFPAHQRPPRFCSPLPRNFRPGKRRFNHGTGKEWSSKKNKRRENSTVNAIS
jgi:hypothetical protein